MGGNFGIASMRPRQVKPRIKFGGRKKKYPFDSFNEAAASKAADPLVR